MLHGSITPTDYLNAQRLHRARYARGYVILCIFLILAAFVLAAFYQRHLGVIVGLVGGLGLTVEILIATVFLPWQVRRLHAQQKDLATPFNYSWDDEYLEVKGANGQAKRPWRNYAKYLEDERVFLVYHADNIFEMLPKRWFKDEAQIAEFRQLADLVGKR